VVASGQITSDLCDRDEGWLKFEADDFDQRIILVARPRHFGGAQWYFEAMFQMLGVFAEFERTMIAERIRAGLARARSEGKRLGRPPIAPALEKRIREALATPGRPGVRIIAKRFSVDPGTVQRISRPFAGAGAVAAIP
jgi:DNA invertase Pin-like site-specific DNA recombinase